MEGWSFWSLAKWLPKLEPCRDFSRLNTFDEITVADGYWVNPSWVERQLILKGSFSGLLPLFARNPLSLVKLIALRWNHRWPRIIGAICFGLSSSGRFLGVPCIFTRWFHFEGGGDFSQFAGQLIFHFGVQIGTFYISFNWFIGFSHII